MIYWAQGVSWVLGMRDGDPSRDFSEKKSLKPVRRVNNVLWMMRRLWNVRVLGTGQTLQVWGP